MDSDAILVCVLSSTLAATVITSVKELVLWYLNRNAQVQDNEKESKYDQLSAKVASQKESIEKVLKSLSTLEERIDTSCKSSKVLLQCRIKKLILRHLEDGEISFEDRKLIHEMWAIYHYGLNGNGDLDDLIERLDELPLKM